MDAAVAWFGMSFAPTLIIELVARVPHPRLMAGPRAAARAGEIRAGHGGIKSRETSVARNWHRSGLCQFRSCELSVELAMSVTNVRTAAVIADPPPVTHPTFIFGRSSN